MKLVISRYSAVLFLLILTSVVFAGPFRSKIITTEPLVIHMPDDRLLKITNFSQEGGIERGVVAVTLGGDTETGGTATVLTATRIDFSSGSNSQNFPEIGYRVIIAGPADVTVAPVSGATLFITYKKEPNEGGGGSNIVLASPTPTPIIIFSPTPTPTPGL